MGAIGTDVITALLREHYIPVLEMTRSERRLHFELQYGMPNPMPMFGPWWPWLDRLVYWRAEAPARLRGALEVLRWGVPVDGDGW